MVKSVKSNIWKYTIHSIANKRTYMSIFGVYLLTLPNATAKTMGWLLLIGNLASFIFEIPSGYLSDKLGHKEALVFGRIALLLSTIFYLIGLNIVWFIIGSILLSIGHAFISGTGTAFMHETLQEMHKEKDFSKIMGRVSSIGFAVPIVFIILIPFLSSISFRTAFIIPAIIDVIGLIITLTLVSPKKSRRAVEEISNKKFTEVVKEGHRFGFFPYVFLLALIASAITATSSFKSIYQQLLGVPIIYYGIFWAMSRVLVSALLLMNHKVKNWLSFHQFIMIQFCLALILIISLGRITNAWIIVPLFVLIAAFNWSFKEAKNHYLLELIKESKFKATLISVNELLTKLMLAGGSLMIGIISVKFSFQLAFLTIAGLLLVLGIMMWSWVYLQKKTRLLS